MSELSLKLKKQIVSAGKTTVSKLVVMALIVMVLAALTLYVGNTTYPPEIIIRVLMGEKVAKASYAIRSVRLPRMLGGLFAGLCFGCGGYIFQSMLRNNLASPDMIGITTGSSVAAIFCILVAGLSGTVASAISVAGGLRVTVLIFVLSSVNGFSNGRMILIGIGMQASLRAVLQYIILKASTYDVPAAMRWLFGSLNGIRMKNVPVLMIVSVVGVALVSLIERQLKIIELGDESAIALGVKVNVVRAMLSVIGVIMLAFAIAVTGPVASVAFLSGPISKKITGNNNSSSFASALTGVILVLGSDLIGQFVLGTRFLVGVITGLFGAPYLLYIMVTTGSSRDS